ncbi:MAG: exodeoxyribonuclease VII large subunit, partial [Bacilli bacterium]|nr:exodeoxyribonuclease VII large subunit [Bacilli bacterium]
EDLKKKLAADGLFDGSRKRPIARFPKKIGVIAGEGSAGMKDIVFNITKRWPMAELLLFPSLVQGEGAPKALIQAFKKAQDAGLDTLIIGRGGGSSEDLGAFNDEALVREVATSHCPVISAVGHEIDVTLLDYVADLRVSTPTGAAVAATPDQNEIRQGIDSMEERLQKALEARLGHIRVKLDLISQRSFFLRPEAVYEPAKEKVTKASEHLMLGTKAQLDRKTSQLSVLSGKLSTLNPYAVLSRGYGITQTSSGKVLTSVQDVGEGEQIQTRLKDGMITATVLKKEQKDGK